MAPVTRDSGRCCWSARLWRSGCRVGQGLECVVAGESEAGHLGIDVEGLKRELVVLYSVGCGRRCSGGDDRACRFAVPHLVRLLAGPDHRVLLPASARCARPLLADLVARLALAPAELPIGIVTAFIGAPFFLFLLLRRRA